MVKHKLFGMGEVINKEVVGDYTYITARFDTGKELRFVIPTSFETGAVEAIGTLKDEVEQAIADREARRAVTTTPVAVATPTVPATRTRTKPKTTATGPMADAFEKYLINKGYKIETDKGKRSTVYFYLDAVELVRSEEGLSWDCLKKNISSVIPQYEKGGAKEVIGARQHRTVIDALKQFSEFVDHP